jgi:hypothetical protein
MFEPGSHRRSFALNSNGVIQEYRDYGDQVMSPINSQKEFEQRIELLDQAKGNYLMALTTWDIISVQRNAPNLYGKLVRLLSESEVVILKPDNTEDALAAYLLANETGSWVLPTAHKEVNLSKTFTAKKSSIEDFVAEFDSLKTISKKLNQAEVLSVKEAMAGKGPIQKRGLSVLTPTGKFGRPRYKKSLLSYFRNQDVIRGYAQNLS